MSAETSPSPLLERVRELHDQIRVLGAQIERDRQLPEDLTMRARLRLAITHATSAATGVDLAHRAAGGTAVYASSPLQRQFLGVYSQTLPSLSRSVYQSYSGSTPL